MLNKFIAVMLTASLIPATLASCGRASAITLNGTVESEQADIFAEKPGRVVKLMKEEGQLVDKGEAVLMTDSETQALILKQQQAFADMKKARLDELNNGTRPEQIKQAEAALTGADARLAELQKGSRPEQIAQAKAAADAAKARLDELQQGSRPEQIAQAEAAMNSAKSAVDTAQANYDLAKDKYDKAMALLASGGISRDEADTAKNKLDVAASQLQSVKSQYNLAKSQYDLVKNGPTSQSIEAAQANYNQALAQLELVSNGNTEEAIRAAKANRDQLAAQLDMLRNGNTAQAIQAAKADYEQALAQVEQAKLALDKYLVKSPFKGVFIQSNIKEGELLNTGANIGTVSDLTDLWVNFYITQADLGNIKLNQEVSMTSKALQGQDIKGRIVFISDKSEFTPKNIETNEAKENTVFRFKVKITTNIDKLRPGMTISVKLPYGGAK